MSIGSPDVEDLQSQIEPLIGKMKIKYPHWINAPDGSQPDSWCGECGYFKMRNLRRHNKKHRDEYNLDGGWRTEEEHFCFCQHCGVRLSVCLTDYGLDEEIRHYQENGLCTSASINAYEINELLERVEYGDDEETLERRQAVVEVARQFLAQVNGVPA